MVGLLRRLIGEFKTVWPLIFYGFVTVLPYFASKHQLLNLEDKTVYFLVLLIFVLIDIIYVYSWVLNKPHYSFNKVALSFLSGSFPTVATVIALAIFTIYNSWLADYLKDGDIKNTVINILFLFGLPFAFLVSLPELKKIEVSRDVKPKKVYICALSLLDEKKRDELEKAIKEGASGEDLLNKFNISWTMIYESLRNHKDSLENWYLLVSNESRKQLCLFKKFIRACFDNDATAHRILKAIRVIPKEGGLDFNDFETIRDELLYVLKEIKRMGYDDEDVSVFISPGTSAVTIAFTLFAVREGVQVEYKPQGKGDKITAINVGPRDLFALNSEILLK
ncbi:hypothetical protein SAMN05444391_0397 [Thermocrinis minervae]|uniref:Uncharacterized protein n=2 Tax=Thermocrinis minervae TaxID=381751 RepID=A0A1M6QUC0_9AQUI|nr:hypothetical protein SAMN05444391_0397 [Thermocrinis minervae]